jgi:hypothetical protein
MPSQSPKDDRCSPFPSFLLILVALQGALVALQGLAWLRIQAAQIRKAEAEAEIAEARARKKSLWLNTALTTAWARVALDGMVVLLALLTSSPH